LAAVETLEFYEVRRDELVSSMAGVVLARLDVS
jgi:hypothetical protein